MQGSSASGIGRENVNVQATNVAPTECPDEAADEFAFTGSADCADRNATVRVAIDESWYDCSSTAATTTWLHCS